MDKKENKKGFWSMLFAPKKKSCCCNSGIIVEEDVKPAQSCGCTAEPSDSTESPCCGSSAGKVTDVKVLGPGCAKCKTTYSVVERVIKESGLDVKLTKVEDIAEMMNYNILSTPAVVVDGEVRIKGHVPTEDEVKKILGI